MREMILERGFGIINCGEHLGVFVSPRENISNTPPGWVFLATEDLDEKTLEMALEKAYSGRKNWPLGESIPLSKKKRRNRR